MTDEQYADLVAHLHVIASLLDDLGTSIERLTKVAEDIEDATAESAFRSHGPIWRWRVGRKAHKMFTRMGELHLEPGEETPAEVLRKAGLN